MKRQLYHHFIFDKVQRADLTCDVTRIRLRRFEPWSISNKNSNFAPVTWHVSDKVTTLYAPSHAQLEAERRATWFEIMKNNKQTPSLPPRFLFIRQFLSQNFSMLFIGLVSWSGIAGCLMNWLHLASSIKCVFCGEQVGKYHCVIWWWHVLSRIFKEKSFQKSPTYPPLCHALCSIA